MTAEVHDLARERRVRTNLRELRNLMADDEELLTRTTQHVREDLMKKEKKALTVNEAAHRLGVSDPTVRRMVQDGRLAHFRLGDGPRAGVRIPAEEVDRYMGVSSDNLGALITRLIDLCQRIDQGISPPSASAADPRPIDQGTADALERAVHHLDVCPAYPLGGKTDWYALQGVLDALIRVPADAGLMDQEAYRTAFSQTKELLK